MTGRPLDAYKVAYAALDGTLAAQDRAFQTRMAAQIVATIERMRRDCGLVWLRRVGQTRHYYDRAHEVTCELGPDPARLIGALGLWKAYEAVAEVFVREYGRRRVCGVPGPAGARCEREPHRSRGKHGALVGERLELW